jgi:hypothetical protein
LSIIDAGVGWFFDYVHTGNSSFSTFDELRVFPPAAIPACAGIDILEFLE